MTIGRRKDDEERSTSSPPHGFPTRWSIAPAQCRVSRAPSATSASAATPWTPAGGSLGAAPCRPARRPRLGQRGAHAPLGLAAGRAAAGAGRRRRRPSPARAWGRHPERGRALSRQRPGGLRRRGQPEPGRRVGRRRRRRSCPAPPDRSNAVGVVAGGDERRLASAPARAPRIAGRGPRYEHAADADAAIRRAAAVPGLIAIFGALGGIAGAVALFVGARREPARSQSPSAGARPPVLRRLGATPRQVRRRIAGEALLVSLSDGRARRARRPAAGEREGPRRSRTMASVGPRVGAPRRGQSPSPPRWAWALGDIAQVAVAAAARRAGRIPPADALREVAIEHTRDRGWWAYPRRGCASPAAPRCPSCSPATGRWRSGGRRDPARHGRRPARAGAPRRSPPRRSPPRSGASGQSGLLAQCGARRQ